MSNAGTVHQACGTVFAEPAPPPPRGRARDPHLRRDMRDRTPRLDALNHDQPAGWSQPGISVGHERPPCERAGELDSSNSTTEVSPTSTTIRVSTTRWRTIRTESGSALLLVVVAAVALLWANSPLSEAYFGLWDVEIGFDVGGFGLHMNLHHWINDGLMVVFFFFVVGLEVRQEFAHGSLRDASRARLALIAGVAGVALPAVFYILIVAAAGGDGLGGWGAVVGTDTAFLLGALALVGPKLSGQLRVFLLTLTVVDDLLAVSIIGIVYSDEIRLVPLLIAVACLAGLWLLGRSRQWSATPYVLIVIVLWFATVDSGVHASLAGMVAGLLIPAYPTRRHKVVAARQLFRDFWQSPSAASARAVDRGLAGGISVNERMHEVLRMPTALVIVPIFALANAGVDLRGGVLVDSFQSSVTWGVIVGLVLGKLLGIGLATFVAVKLGAGRLPEGVGMGSVFGGAALSGIGFTVSLLVIGLAFGSTSDLGRQATVGVLVAMVLATALGWLIFRVAAKRWGEETADLPMVLTPPVDPEVDHIRGPEDAQLTLVEYIDFECPYCAHATGSWDDLRSRFGDDLRYVVRQLPHHPHGPIAARASEAASNQGMFWPWLDFVFTRQDALEREDLIRYAEELGLDVAQFTADLDSAAVRARVERDLESADASGAHATPTFFVDGRRLLVATTLERSPQPSKPAAEAHEPRKCVPESSGVAGRVGTPARANKNTRCQGARRPRQRWRGNVPPRCGTLPHPSSRILGCGRGPRIGRRGRRRTAVPRARRDAGRPSWPSQGDRHRTVAPSHRDARLPTRTRLARGDCRERDLRPGMQLHYGSLCAFLTALRPSDGLTRPGVSGDRIPWKDLSYGTSQ